MPAAIRCSAGFCVEERTSVRSCRQSFHRPGLAGGLGFRQHHLAAGSGDNFVRGRILVQHRMPLLVAGVGGGLDPEDLTIRPRPVGDGGTQKGEWTRERPRLQGPGWAEFPNPPEQRAELESLDEGFIGGGDERVGGRPVRSAASGTGSSRARCLRSRTTGGTASSRIRRDRGRR
jgi:hypothetical protein